MKRIIYMLCLLGLTACVPLKPTPIPTPPAVFGSAATAVTIEPDWFVESWRGDQILLKYDSIGEWNIPSTFGRLFEISSHTYTPLELNDSIFSIMQFCPSTQIKSIIQSMIKFGAMIYSRSRANT